MMGGTYLENLRRSLLPEFISMNAMMAGMAPTMRLLMMGRDMRAMEPTELLFWGVMSLGVVVGFTTAYPVNVWLVKRGLKHGLMTERKPGSRSNLAGPQAQGKAHQDHAAPVAASLSQASQHARHQLASTIQLGITPAEPAPPHHGGSGGDGSKGHGGSDGMTSDATVPQIAAVAGVTALFLLALIPAQGAHFRVQNGAVQSAPLAGERLPLERQPSTFQAPGSDQAAFLRRPLAGADGCTGSGSGIFLRRAPRPICLASSDRAAA